MSSLPKSIAETCHTCPKTKIKECNNSTIGSQMSGWSKRVDGSKNLLVDYDNAKLLFIEVLTIFFKQVTGNLYYRPLPPMLGDGKSVDLFKLYLVVRENGGYQGVCGNGLWGLVAENCGFDLSYGLAVKLVYVKYLDALEKWMLKLKKNNNSKCDLGSVELDLQEILTKISDEKAKESENGDCNSRKKGEQVCDDIEVRGFEGFDGKSNLDSNATTRSVVEYEEENLKFVDGIDDSLTKYSMVEEDYISRKRKKGFDTTDGEQLCNGVGARGVEGLNESTGEQLCNGVEGLNESTEGFDGKSNLDSNVIIRSAVLYEEENLKFVDGTDDSLTKSSIVEEDSVSRKRKRESYLNLVKWVNDVARNPCDLSIGILPERSKWKEYGTEVVWKQVLLLRDEMLMKRQVDPCERQFSIWQIKQKMHPSMYDDTSGSGRLRCSQRVLSAKDHLKKMRALQFSVSPSCFHNDEDQVDGPSNSSAESAVGFWWKQRRKKIPVGPQFQADIPELIEEIYESDSKWLGTRIWPLDKQRKKRTSIDRGPIGKGRQDICSCRSPGSYDCVKFHLFEKRRKVKIDLGSAYYQWKFDSMGEEVALSWSREEERKFQDIVKSNPLSEEKSFWNEIFKFFPNKSRESLVSYYFNVFLLRRRGNQNRTNASIVDSDDDESEYGPRFDCFGRDAKFSIFRSPRKSTSGSEVVHVS